MCGPLHTPAALVGEGSHSVHSLLRTQARKVIVRPPMPKKSALFCFSWHLLLRSPRLEQLLHPRTLQEKIIALDVPTSRDGMERWENRMKRTGSVVPTFNDFPLVILETVSVPLASDLGALFPWAESL